MILRETRKNKREAIMRRYHFTVVIERDEDGIYIASCPAIQGCHTQGTTYEEALENIKDAISLHLQTRKELGEKR